MMNVSTTRPRLHFSQPLCRRIRSSIVIGIFLFGPVVLALGAPPDQRSQKHLIVRQESGYRQPIVRVGKGDDAASGRRRLRRTAPIVGLAPVIPGAEAVIYSTPIKGLSGTAPRSMRHFPA